VDLDLAARRLDHPHFRDEHIQPEPASEFEILVRLGGIGAGAWRGSLGAFGETRCSAAKHEGRVGLPTDQNGAGQVARRVSDAAAGIVAAGVRLD